MTSFLSTITYEIGSYVQWATSTTATIFQFFTLIGKFLLQSIAFVLEAIQLFFVNLTVCSGVFLHEFVLFLRDINDLSNTLLKLLNNAGDNVVQTLSNGLNFIQHVLTQAHLLAYAVSDGVISLLISILINAKALLILIGNSTLFLVQLGPAFLFSVLEGTTSLIYWTVSIVWLYVSQIALCVLAFFQVVHYELTDIPPSSLLGVLLALVISIGFRFYFKSILWMLCWQKTKTLASKWLRRMPQFRRASAGQQQVTTSSPKCETALELDDHSNRHLLRQLEQEREDKLCVICHDRFKCVILLPCRHFCLCQTCVQVIEQTDPSCPLCRHYVIDSLRVYC